ncbi:hypothetical protein Q5P01_007265 [Channa striata]|uniref:Uncharacterized protein n=1 Tax=Channa striata TaxID=64152 RepID=A0AA88STL4_CHASR|nr:hypothetical protein Q5P01_007265 [Channa striata]
MNHGADVSLEILSPRATLTPRGPPRPAAVASCVLTVSHSPRATCPDKETEAEPGATLDSQRLRCKAYKRSAAGSVARGSLD